MIPERHVRSEYRRSAHSAQSSDTNSDSIVVTYPFHPLTKRRLRILFERRRRGERFYICDYAERTVTLAENWTDRGEPPAAGVRAPWYTLNYRFVMEAGEAVLPNPPIK